MRGVWSDSHQVRLSITKALLSQLKFGGRLQVHSNWWISMIVLQLWSSESFTYIRFLFLIGCGQVIGGEFLASIHLWHHLGSHKLFLFVLHLEKVSSLCLLALSSGWHRAVNLLVIMLLLELLLDHLELLKLIKVFFLIKIDLFLLISKFIEIHICFIDCLIL